jgi:polysaccharide biosynthesis protein PslH
MFDRTNRDRLLMLTPIMPSDRGHGLAMRAGFFVDAYTRRFEVDLVVIPVAGAMEPSPFVQSRVRRIEILKVDHPDSHFALLSSIRDPMTRLDAFRRYARPSLAAFVRPACRSLQAWAASAKYNAVHVSRLYLAELAAPWLGKDRGGTRLVLDCDENDALVYRRLAALERRQQHTIAAAWAEAEAEALGRFAAEWLPKFDVIFAASHKEAKSLSPFGVRALVAPNVVPEFPLRPRRRRRQPYTIVFVGTLGYAPNADAVTWFVSRIWRRLECALHFRVRLLIVGANPPAAIARLGLQRGIEVTGAVANIARYYRDADLAIAPLRAGGGTRIKVIEAAAQGVPLVTTVFGAEGTTFQRGVDMLMANDGANFLRACLLLLRDGSLAGRLAAQARAKAKRDYSPTYWRARVARLVAGRDETCAISTADEETDVGGG